MTNLSKSFVDVDPDPDDSFDDSFEGIEEDDAFYDVWEELQYKDCGCHEDTTHLTTHSSVVGACVDRGVLSLVETLNMCGFRTLYCCEGGPPSPELLDTWFRFHYLGSKLATARVLKELSSRRTRASYGYLLFPSVTERHRLTLAFSKAMDSGPLSEFTGVFLPTSGVFVPTKALWDKPVDADPRACLRWPVTPGLTDAMEEAVLDFA